jgi:F0F1-type ATP synthase membrane subunit b/b'
MTEIQNSPRVEEGIFTHSLSDYRSKVEEIIRTENERFRELAEEQATGIIDNAWKKAEEIISESREKAKEIISESQNKAYAIISDSQEKASNISNEIEQQAKQKTSEVLKEADQRARHLIQEAEEKATADAKNRVRSQEEKIISKAKQEASSIVADARKTAEKETDEIIERTKQEAERRVEEEIEKVRTQAQEQAVQIRIEAERKAAKLIDKIVGDGGNVNEMIIGAIKNSEDFLEKMKSDLQEEIGKLTKGLMTARKSMEQSVTDFSEKSEAASVLQTLHKGLNKKLALWVTLRGNKTAVKSNSDFLFRGQIELKTLSTMDYTLVRELKTYLSKVPHVKYLGESSSEEGSILSFEIQEPLPIIDILGSIPLVENAEILGDNIKLTLG